MFTFPVSEAEWLLNRDIREAGGKNSEGISQVRLRRSEDPPPTHTQLCSAILVLSSLQKPEDAMLFNLEVLEVPSSAQRSLEPHLALHRGLCGAGNKAWVVHMLGYVLPALLSPGP